MRGVYRTAGKSIMNYHPWALNDNRINTILIKTYVKHVKEHLTPLDVGPYLNQVDFSKVDLEK